jgi:hypothetical protein
VSSVTVFTALLGSGYQRRTFPFLWVPELSPTSATSFSTDCLQTPSRLTDGRSVGYIAAGFRQHSHSRLQSPRYPCPRFLFLPKPVRVSKWGLLFDEGGQLVLVNSFGTDRTEITATNSSSDVACMCVVAISWQLLSHCLATGVFTGPFQRLSLLTSQFGLWADMPQYITIYSRDPNIVKITIWYGISSKNTEIYIQYNWSFHITIHRCHK